MSRMKPNKRGVYFFHTIYPLDWGFAPNERSFQREMRKMGFRRKYQHNWCDFSACTHSVKSKNGRNVVLVTVDKYKHENEEQIISSIIHEAVHVWQHMMEFSHQSKSDEDEIEAYTIQGIASSIMAAAIHSGVLRRNQR